jgi:hypothetical protein
MAGARREPQLFPSPLAGEGGVRVSGRRVRGEGNFYEESPLIRPRWREGTFSHKGRRKKARGLTLSPQTGEGRNLASSAVLWC